MRDEDAEQEAIEVDEPAVAKTPNADDADPHAIPRSATDVDGEDLAIARDYLRQLQDTSMRGLAQWALGISDGAWRTESEHLDGVVDNIRAARGRSADPHGELGDVVEGYSSAVEQICKSLNFPLRGGVAAGIVYQPSDVPAQTPVLGTNASVIVIPEHSLMLCHYVCKALALACPFEVEPTRYAVSIKPKRILKRLRKNPEILSYLARTVAYCATNDPQCLAGLQFKPLANGSRSYSRLFVMRS